jgi:hypothetical protein
MLLLKTRSDGKGGHEVLVVNSADGDKGGQKIHRRWISQEEFDAFYDPEDARSWVVIQIGFPR